MRIQAGPDSTVYFKGIQDVSALCFLYLVSDETTLLRYAPKAIGLKTLTHCPNYQAILES